MTLTVYRQPVDPLDITRARIEAGLAFEKHRFGLPLPGESAILEVFERGGDGTASGCSLMGRALQDSVARDKFSGPAIHVWLLVDPEDERIRTLDGDVLPEWLDAILQQPDELYLLVPRWIASVGPEQRRAPHEIVSDYLGTPLTIRGLGTLLRMENRRAAFRLLIQPEFRNAALLANPIPRLLDAHASGSARAPLFSGFARGGVVAFADFCEAVSQCDWLMTTHTLESIAISLYASEDRHDLVTKRLAGHAPQWVETLEQLPQLSEQTLPPPYQVRQIEPEGARFEDAERLTLWARGSLTDLLSCHGLAHLVADDSLWLDRATIAQLSNLHSLSIQGIKLQDVDFLRPLPRLEKLCLSRLPVAGLAELEKLVNLRTLEVREVTIPSLAFVQKLHLLQSLHIDRLAAPHQTLPELAGHPGLHTLVLPEPQLQDLAPLADLTLHRFETWSSQVSDLEALSSQHRLRRLLLQNTPVVDLSPLGGLQALQEVWLMACPIRDLTPLSRCPALRLLDLQYGSEVIWQGLADLQALEVLYLQYSNLSDVELLSTLPRLRTLDLRGTDIDSVQPLMNIETLEHLVIADTGVRDLAPLTKCPRLRQLVIDETQRQTVSLVGLDTRVVSITH